MADLDIKKIHAAFKDAVDSIGDSKQKSPFEGPSVLDQLEQPKAIQEIEEKIKTIDAQETTARKNREKQHRDALTDLDKKTSTMRPKAATALRDRFDKLENEKGKALQTTLRSLEKDKKRGKEEETETQKETDKEIKPVKDLVIAARDAAEKIRDVTDETSGKEINRQELNNNLSIFYISLGNAIKTIDTAKEPDKSTLHDYKEPLLKLLEKTNDVNPNENKEKIRSFITREKDKKEASPTQSSESHTPSSAQNSGGHTPARQGALHNQAISDVVKEFKSMYPQPGDPVVLGTSRKHFINDLTKSTNPDFQDHFLQVKNKFEEIVKAEKKGTKISADDLKAFDNAVEQIITETNNIPDTKEAHEGRTKLPTQLKAIQTKIHDINNSMGQTSSITEPSQRQNDRKQAVESLKLFTLIDNPKNPGDVLVKQFIYDHKDLAKNFTDAKKIAEEIIENEKLGKSTPADDVKKLHEAMKEAIEKSHDINQKIGKGEDWIYLNGSQLLPRYLNAIEDKLQKVPDLSDQTSSNKTSSVTEPSKKQLYAVQEADPSHYGQLSPTTLTAQTRYSGPNIPGNGGWTKA